MVGWHHQLDGHEFEQTLRDGEGQGNLGCCMQSMGLQSVGHDLATKQTHISTYRNIVSESFCCTPETNTIL